MDASKQYCQMCDCPEIQGIFKGFDLSQFPNYVYDKITERVSIIFWTPRRLKAMVGNKGNVLIVSIESDREKNQHVPEYEGDFCDSVIWFPRQDQLQEMVKSSELEGRPRVLELVERFNGYCATNTIGYFLSMEQLWLAFVMKEKFNKIWNGTEWENSK